MGDDREISEAARAFLHGHVDSVIVLEVLLLLHGSPDRYWTDEEVARELRVTPSWVSGMLRGLHGQGVLGRRADPAEPAAYRFEPSDPRHVAALAELAEAYATRRVTITQMIFTKAPPTPPPTPPPAALRSFADAFRIRRDKDEERS